MASHGQWDFDFNKEENQLAPREERSKLSNIYYKDYDMKMYISCMDI